ncbi:DUF2829 domain-containing protein [Phaeobacter sp. S60]|uniref:DUF2829 domain-containing protein n=1 Tax=Phaeobacter sp. S60 TaxID=1569353 RepID=UPI00058B7212|nr:DUF2829 domain-containing protein [Phaeobacter sp. S60]KII11253.1 hypothetical protein OO25_21730 [Phaeobacter sp. S60]
MSEVYYGTKQIKAVPMNRQAYNDYRGWELPADEDGSDAGFLVEYVDGGASNHPDHEGYISWSPADVFERAYQSSGSMNFGHALQAVKEGHRVARAGWNGKGMFIVLMPRLELPPFNTQGTARKVNDRTAKWIGEETPLDCQPYLAMWTADKKWQPGWLASQADMLADDWLIVAD